ncbi:MAG: tyrosine-type recombinase/integrase [Myxococcota bacterium]
MQPHTFGELCDLWLRERAPLKRSEKDDQSAIRRHLRPAFGELRLHVVERRVAAYTLDRRHLAAKTVFNHLTLLASMLRYAVELGWLREAPRIRKPRRVKDQYKWLRSRAEIRELLAAAKTEHPMAVVLFATALYTGMRAGELGGLRWEDVDFDRRLIDVRRTYTRAKGTKNDETRNVPIVDALLPLLRAWKDVGTSPWVFVNCSGRPLRPSARVFQEVFQRCLRRARIATGKERLGERITFHDMRHTFASHWMMAGGDIFKLQKILGHSSLASTLRYAHLAPEAFREDWGRLGSSEASGIDFENFKVDWARFGLGPDPG